MSDRAEDEPERPVSDEAPLPEMFLPRAVMEIPRLVDTAVARGS